MVPKFDTERGNFVRHLMEQHARRVNLWGCHGGLLEKQQQRPAGVSLSFAWSLTADLGWED